MTRKYLSIIGLLVVANFSSLVLAQDCADDEVCFVDVAGAECADGSATGFAITYRKGAKDLLIYLDGGGACWSQGTCSKGTASHLSAYGKYEGPYSGSGNPMNVGLGDISNAKSPFASGFNMVRVPYCTGDVFIGNKVQNYGTAAVPYKIRHVGYKNLELILAEVQKRIPTAERLVFYGVSAGGLGVSWNVHQVAKSYPTSEVFVINDGGALFRPPQADTKKLKEVYEAWDAESNSPVTSYSSASTLVADVVSYHQTNYPKVRYGYMSTYNDLVMTGFAGLLKASKIPTAVRNTMIALADGEFAASGEYQVFYKSGTEHVFFKRDPDDVESLGVTVGTWIADMISGSSSWTSVRPDKASALQVAGN